MAERSACMILSSEGGEAAGKTHFALTAPRPITLLDFDYGTDGLDNSGNVDDHKLYDLTIGVGNDAAARQNAQKVMKQFIADFRKALADGVRTIVVDTFTAAWNSQKFAREDDKWEDKVNEIKALVSGALLMAKTSGKTNVILIHHTKPDWVKRADGQSFPSGTYSLDGMPGIKTMVQLAIRQRFIPPMNAGDLKVPGKFEIDILKSRDNMGLMGLTFPSMDFASLCSLVAPGIDWAK